MSLCDVYCHHLISNLRISRLDYFSFQILCRFHTGRFPAIVGELTNITVLSLRGNELHGKQLSERYR